VAAGPALTKTRSARDQHLGLDLDRHPEWQLGHPDGGSRVRAGLAEQLDDQVGEAVRLRIPPGAGA